MMNFHSPDVRRNPYPVYAQLRATNPVLAIPQLKLWMVADYEGVKRALTDHEAFSSSMATANRPAPEWLVFFDPPKHTKLRGLISKAFTPKVVAALEPRLQELCRELLDPHMAAGEMDLADDFSIPLPIMVIAELIGVPPTDRARFRRWGDIILNLSFAVAGGEEHAQATAEYFAAQAEMSSYLDALIADRKAAPKPDLLTKLIEAEIDGERLSNRDILNFFQLLLVAATETTTNLINNAALCFLENPSELAKLRARPELLPSAIEEVLRYRSPFQWTFRATRVPVELHGQTIPANTLVLVVMGSANRDGQVFSEPDRFDISRDPNPHVAFGQGLHFCLGAALSRLEAKVALSEFLNRTQSFERATSEPWEPRRALHVHGPTRLPIRFEANTHSAART